MVRLNGLRLALICLATFAAFFLVAQQQRASRLQRDVAELRDNARRLTSEYAEALEQRVAVEARLREIQEQVGLEARARVSGPPFTRHGDASSAATASCPPCVCPVCRPSGAGGSALLESSVSQQQERRFDWKLTPPEGVAIIVEPRDHPNLVPIIQNFVSNLPSTWPIQLYHSSMNLDYILGSRLAPLIDSGRVVLTPLWSPYDTTRMDGSAYSRLLCSSRFFELALADKILIFQTDTVLCSNSKHNISAFLGYDYVGAPWFHINQQVGNGGLSLRTKSSALAILEKHQYHGGGLMEDQWWVEQLKSDPRFKVAPFEIAYTFSTETMYKRGYDFFGVHKPSWWIGSQPDLDDLFIRCPEAKMIPWTFDRIVDYFNILQKEGRPYQAWTAGLKRGELVP